MKKIFMAFAVVALTTACNEMEVLESSSNFMVTGYNETNADSRTAFVPAPVPLLSDAGRADRVQEVQGEAGHLGQPLGWLQTLPELLRFLLF